MNNYLVKELIKFEKQKGANLPIIEKVKLFIQNEHNLLRKNNSQIHLSASAVVLKKDTCFFIEHPYLKKILLPAGHVEETETPLQTAIREFNEETGYYAVKDSGQLIDINFISIPKNDMKNETAHEHIDFRYLLQLDYQAASVAELPFFLLKAKDAPVEFQKYFK